MGKSIYLPWRAFKAFHQLFCQTNLDPGLLPENQKDVSLFNSHSTAAGDYVRTMVEKGALVTVYDDLEENIIGINLAPNAVPYGYVDYLKYTPVEMLVVCPSNGSENGKSWIESAGHCDYCGSPLTLFGKDSLGKRPSPLSGNAWACKTCQTIKSNHSLDEFRWLMTMRKFEQDKGVRFTKEQLDYLNNEVGMSNKDLGVEDYHFKFESYHHD